MAKARKNNNIYIYRKADKVIENKITNKEGKVLFVHGQGGVGKSTLLRKFLNYKEADEKIPIIYLNLQSLESTTFVDILFDKNTTKIKNCKYFEKVRSRIVDDPILYSFIVEAYSEETAKAFKQISSDKTYGFIVQIGVDIIKLLIKFFKSKNEQESKEIKNNLEYVLVSALVKDFKRGGLFMVDTLEKNKEVKLSSIIDFEDGKIFKSLNKKNIRFKGYIAGLAKSLNSTFVIAGRNQVDDLSMDLDEEDIEELCLEKFTSTNIQEFFSLYAKKNKELGMPSAEKLKIIEELTKGNPLLVGLFTQIAKEYDTWNELDYKEMERRIKTDEKHGLLFYMTDRVLSHLDESIEV